MKMPVQNTNPDVGFQIAPMIDVVFVILVFFMSLAAQIRIEHRRQRQPAFGRLVGLRHHGSRRRPEEGH